MELSELIESVDILDYISQYTDFTEKNGEYWALSPLKDENTPSFSVRKETNSFFDFSSGIGGNVLTFIRYYDKCSMAEAVEKLKKYSGFNGKVSSKKRLAATEVAKRFAPPHSTAKKAKGTVLPDDYMERYEKRDDKLAAWEREGISRASIDKFSVYYDSFSDRLVYPIRNPDGKIVNIGGRTLDPHWKEKGLRKYTYFYGWNGGMNVVYGLSENKSEIIRQHQVIVFEGAKSVLLADTYGIKNSVAILTSHLNPQQLRIFAALGCEVVFALDKEINIREDHNIKKLKQFVNISYIWDKANHLDEKDSPVDKGREVFAELLSERRRWK